MFVITIQQKYKVNKCIYPCKIRYFIPDCFYNLMLVSFHQVTKLCITPSVCDL